MGEFLSIQVRETWPIIPLENCCLFVYYVQFSIPFPAWQLANPTCNHITESGPHQILTNQLKSGEDKCNVLPLVCKQLILRGGFQFSDTVTSQHYSQRWSEFTVQWFADFKQKPCSATLSQKLTRLDHRLCWFPTAKGDLESGPKIGG